MEKKINVAELLKDCPAGMELDCTIFGTKVIYQKIYKTAPYPIVVQTEHGFEFRLTQYGQIYNIVGAECVIFPKGKTTWEGFVPSCKFKDGDIAATENGLFIGIVKVKNNNGSFETYCAINDVGSFSVNISYYFERFATEEEKQRLFDAIKAKGYYWNEETKTLEKLVVPKFKVGYRIKSKISKEKYTVIDIRENVYFIMPDNDKCGISISFASEINYELVPNKFDIKTLKPFDKVLVRDKDTDAWEAHFFSYYYKNSDRPYICIGFKTLNEYKQCIPYEGNEHLLNKKDDCDEYYKNWK